ncbi:MAG TPA: type II toxin-antitoxin system VapC family toxin [Candidatus Babeliales bacterium]|nr:type II toxin-antitoxin system VapC family toxin [Candidatus Babeliales bacterium]
MWAADDLLKPSVVRVVDAAARRGELLLSPISAWEIGMLSRRGRLSLALTVDEYVRLLFSRPGVVLAAITPSLALAAAMLPEKPISDPADRLMIATAAAYGAHLVTHDKKVREYAKTTRHLRCIEC